MNYTRRHQLPKQPCCLVLNQTPGTEPFVSPWVQALTHTMSSSTFLSMAAHDTCNSSLSKDGKQQGQNIVSTVKQALLCVLYRDDTCSPHDLLADVVHQAPQLMAALCPTSRAALSSCSRQFRKVVHSLTAVLGVQSFYNIAAIAKGEWPQLCLITVPFQAV